MNILDLVSIFENARKQKKLSEVGVSSKAGLNKTAYFRIKNGSMPKLDNAMNICRVLGIPFRIGDENFNPGRERMDKDKEQLAQSLQTIERDIEQFTASIHKEINELRRML